MARFGRPLPIDIVQLIIDYFDEDRKALADLTLVSRAWVYPARVYLFRLLRVLVSQTHDGLAEFRRFLSTPRGLRHAGHVMYLRLQGVEPADGEQSHWEPTIDLFVLGDVASRLPKLGTFMADRVRFGGVPPHGALPPPAPHVRQLSLARMTTWTYDDLKECLDVLHLFPNATELMTDDLARRVQVTGIRYDGEVPSKFRTFEHLRLQDLHLAAYGPSAPLLTYMLQCMNLRNFTSLTLSHLSRDEIPYLGRFIYAVKDSLRYLSFNTTNVQFVVSDDPDPDPEVYWPMLNLDKCTALEILAIYVNIDFCPWKDRPPAELYSYWEYIEIIFENLPPCLRRIELALEDREDPEWIEEVLLEVQWKHLEKSLKTLPLLEQVLFHTYHPVLVQGRYVQERKCPLENWIQDIIREKLPLLGMKMQLDFMGPRPSRRVPFA